MLVLGSSKGKSIFIDGRRIKLTILDVGGRHGQVKLGFEADRSISINREEVQDKIDKEKEE